MTYSEYFDLACPVYMSYGMTYEQFWYGEPIMAKYYYETHKRLMKQQNEMMWVNGMYTLNALQVALNNAFDKRKIKYVEKPFDIFPKTAAEKQAEIEEERMKLVRWLSGMTTKKKE